MKAKHFEDDLTVRHVVSKAKDVESSPRLGIPNSRQLILRRNLTKHRPSYRNFFFFIFLHVGFVLFLFLFFVFCFLFFVFVFCFFFVFCCCCCGGVSPLFVIDYPFDQ